MKKICIVGDSWGCGEWKADSGNYGVSHRGLEFFLEKKHHVTNLSRGGNSNLDSIKSLEETLSYRNYDFDLIFFFETDPMRNARIDDYNFFKSSQLTFDNLIEENYRLKRLGYEKLNNLGVQIHCIGGCSKTDSNLIKDYKNLVNYIPSLTEFLLDDYQHPVIWLSEWKNYVDRQFDFESIEKIAESYKMQEFLGSKKYTALFQPDGAHPNRFALELLYQKIDSDFNL